MIPDEAVEAAMAHFPPIYRSVVVAALESAAPHMESERVEALKHDLSRAQIRRRPDFYTDTP